LRAGFRSAGLHRPDELRRKDFRERASRNGVRAHDHLLFGESSKHQLRHKQHSELGDQRRNGNFDLPRNIHLHIGERYNECEPNGDDDLYLDSHQCCWLEHHEGNRYR